MQKINSELFKYLTEIENFSVVCELNKTIDTLRDLLINNLGENVVQELNQNIDTANWNVEVTAEFCNQNAEINIYYKKDREKRFCYCISNEKEGICLNIWIDRAKYTKKELTTLFEKARGITDEYDWKVGDEKTSSWPLYFYVEESDFKELSMYKKILPDNLEYYVANEIIADVVNDLKTSVRKLLPYLK